MEKGIITINSLIHITVGPNFQDFINDMMNPHDMLSTLAKVAKPSDAQLHRNLENELDRLHQGPKRLGIEAWLQLHNTITKKAEKINEPPREATSKYLIRHFIHSCQDLNPRRPHQKAKTTKKVRRTPKSTPFHSFHSA